MIAKILVFIFGSCIGSFLNVCIQRMPLGQSVVWPSSHCPHCKKRIPARDNIPFISYMLLKGRCRYCHGKISLRYPLVEALTAVLFLFLFNRYGLSYDFIFYLVFFSGLIIASFVDIQQRIIPDEVSLGGIAVGFLLMSIKGLTLSPFKFTAQPMFNSLLGMISGGGIIYLSGALFDLVYFRLLKRPPIQGETESLGGGDVKFLAMIGAFLGWKLVILTFFLAPFFAVVIGVINLIVKKDHTIPYGPFLALASLVSLFWANRIIFLILGR
jgi:leader peptidase (prepilin peptidase)/N-methyltransferase